ncbi:YicC family protein [Treponema sp. TIM-1]|uniref:YicC/YloC family endoribonuclease n=1 Tax=Treponema sp. TIM-1 TaxID=2898417 RepID=UPI0039816F7D
MKSMTGYAYEERQDERVSLSVEIKGYNSRFLELFIYLPPYLSSLEPKVREYMAGRCRRGKVEIAVRFKDYNSDISVAVNQEAARAYGKAISVLSQILETQEKPSLAAILGMEGVLEVEKNRDDERNWRYIEPCLKIAADRFDEERIREGAHTLEDVFSHLALLESSVQIATSHAPLMEVSIRENLRNRFIELLGDQIDENRILTETAVLLMKYTISEEISRLGSHISEFRLEAERNPSPGKKLDFLCQEMNREINTIGSKTPDLAVSRAVVDMKDALENIREQLRNVE